MKQGIVLIIGLWASLGFGDGLVQDPRMNRALVLFEDQAHFEKVDRFYRKHGQRNLAHPLEEGRSGGGHPLRGLRGHIEKTLPGLKGAILQADDEGSFESFVSTSSVDGKQSPVILIRERIFAPPRVQTSGAYLGSISRSARGVFRITEKTPWGILAVRAPEAWVQAKQGQGARVLVLDTGVDKEHPSLKPNIIEAQDFTGATGLPYPYFDDNGHGTHVAGTILGVQDEGGFTGVAPKAKLLMGKVCESKGCSFLAIAQGLEWAIKTRPDVINLSLGGGKPSEEEAALYLRVSQAGLSVVAASGNDGVGEVSFPAAFPNSIAVGALDVNLNKAAFSQWGQELSVMGPGVDVVSSVPQGTGKTSKALLVQNGESLELLNTFFAGAKQPAAALTRTLIPAGLGKPEELTQAKVAGQFALIQRGELKFVEKVKNAIAAKAVGVVIYNNAPGLVQAALTDDGTTLPIPVVMIEQSVGEQIVKSYQQGQKSKLTLEVTIDDYSSFNGTSMATPHVSGVVALMKAVNPKLSPQQVKRILEETAKALGPNPQNEFGHGLVQADLAVASAQRAR